jgi:uncharacterized repeat protein (TIGR01451 family)
MKNIKKFSFILLIILFLAGGFAVCHIAQAVGGEGTATIDGSANVTVTRATSHKFTVVLTVGVSGITANAQNPTFTIPAGFTPPDAAPVANAGLVVADGNWSVTAAGGTCTVETPTAGLTVAVGQVITVDVTTTCTVAVPDTITLTYQGQSAVAMGATPLNIGTADDIGWGAVTYISDPPTITVTDASATLTVIKSVVNDNGGTAIASAWTLTVTSPNGGTGTGSAAGSESGTVYILQEGKAYSVAESGGPSGYSASPSGDCTIASAVAGTAYTCTITNDDIAPVLSLRKTVINDDAGTALNTGWTLTATGTGGSPTNLTGTTPVDSDGTFKADTYTLAESGGPSGYTASSWTCVGGTQIGSAITVAIGENAICTINNNDVTPAPPSPATLHIIKHVINDDGGSATASDFTINVTGTNVSDPSFTGSEAGMDVTLDAGSYGVTEPVVPTGYLSTGSGDCSGTIAAGETKTCTITNNDIAPQLIVNKVVINDDGSSKVIADFPLFVDGASVISGVATVTTTGSHTVSETADSGYTAVIGGNCAADGTIALALGDVKTCTVTNDDIAPVTPPSSGGRSRSVSPVPPLIDVVKVPSPLALPAGAGLVTYTYTLRNIGTVPVTNITMVDNTCSPVTLISGDINADVNLDVDEIWKYACSTTLSATQTNIVTTTGWANGINAIDIANATVIVGVPVVPPLIHVTKIPNPLVLSAGGGMVTYTNKVTNPGTVALSNVRLTDDKCSSVKYISGDTNGDSKLDITETWTYTCSANLAKTTVNTVTVSGEANGLTARDFAITTVVVDASVPSLPSTGFNHAESVLSWPIVTIGIFVILIFFCLVRRKQI